MKAVKFLGLAGVLAVAMCVGTSTQAQAGFGRQYYGGWNSCSYGYYYCPYYYQPYSGYSGYQYNYCIYYPSYPNYCYYYSPYSNQYWGRYDYKAKGYSLLAEADRAAQLKDIPEKAFPAPAAMPVIPGAKDKLTVEPPPQLPKVGNPDDLPKPEPSKGGDVKPPE